ncbi:MAG: class I SAM-dependent methyltransferase [Eubacterium sp.]|nr:class I SAM-dependent methyltransferase [Eubacterium sp.]
MVKKDVTTNLEFKDNWPFFERFLAGLRYLKIRKYIFSVQNPVCVDIGCGFDGRFLRSIAKHIGRGYGFDIRANERTYRNIRIINNSRFYGKLPLKDSKADCVFMLAVLEHLPMDTPLLSEAVRVLKRGGYFILTTPAPAAKPVLEFLSYRLHLISEESIREHQHYYTKNELLELMKRNGCRAVACQKFQFSFNELIVGKKE